jgi:basic membrane lipoprotein Med (substrate-binding protein (PBP1-ABC) superfamily)
MTNLLLRLLVLVLLAIAATWPATDTHAANLKIGIIMEARPAEQPWSAAIFEAAERLRKRDSSISFSQSFKAFDPTSAEPIARQLLAEGHKVLVLHSFALNDVAHALAKQFKGVPMSVSSFDPPEQPNLNIATASYLQIGYSNCWLLAKISKSGKIGFVGAQPIPYATELAKGCQLGATAARSGAQVLTAYSNSFVDQQATREQAQALVDRGADVLFPASATQDSLGGFQLCEQKGIPCVGWASDARRFSPRYAVMSAIVDWSVMLDSLVKQVRTGKLSSTTFDATYQNRGLIPQPFEGASAKHVPADVREGFKRVLKDLADGKIALPKSKAHPCCP